MYLYFTVSHKYELERLEENTPNWLGWTMCCLFPLGHGVSLVPAAYGSAVSSLLSDI
jgi:hypothetical protein